MDYPVSWRFHLLSTLQILRRKPLPRTNAHKGPDIVFYTLGSVTGCHPAHRRATKAITGGNTGLHGLGQWL